MNGLRGHLVGMVGKGVLAALLALAVTLGAAPARAAGVLSVEAVNADNLVVDSNVTSPATYAPRSGYIGAKVCNAGDAPLANVILNLGDYNPATPATSTPGIFPPWSSTGDPRTFIANTGSYSLTIEADRTGPADGARYLGTLAAGDCRMQYWLFSYPQCLNVDPDGDTVFEPDPPPCATSITGGIKPDDDLSLDYDVWATTTTVGVASASATRSFTLRNEISASANKIWPNTTSKVPDEYLAAIESVLGWGTLGPDGQPLTAGNPVYPGQRVITTQGIWYDLGNVGAGFDNNGDLVPDQNAWLQPVGDPASFDADCFRLVKVYGVVIVKLKTGGELLIPFQDQLYFQNIPDNTGVVGLVYYQYVATGSGCIGNLTPYQEAASGFDNEKFSADYGLSLGLASGSYGSKLAFTKTDGVVTVGLGGTLTYTVTADNDPVGGGTGANLGAPDFGAPLVFSETIPAGTKYVGGSAAAGLAAPSGDGTYQQGYVDADGNVDDCTINFRFSSPASYVVTYSANGGASWSAAEPAPATTVTDIRWTLLTTLLLDGGHDGTACVAPDGSYDNGTLETSLPAGKSASLSFQVTVNNAVPFPGPVFCNTAGLGFGPADPAATAQDCDVVTGNNTISGTVFKDDATGGGIYGNGVKDGTEAGIGAGVVVSLYYDANGDGVRDGGDLLYASTTTAAVGTYSFANLADGAFLVVVKKYDGAVSDGVGNAATDAAFGTAGWGNTTFDPNLPLTSEQGVLKLGEDLTTATLAVNVDLSRNDGAQTVSGVDFGFAPPLRVTKSVAAPTVPEGTFTYTILLENLLPSVGTQGASGCEYTVWALTGVNGPSTGNKNFTNPGDAWDGPNRQVASGLVEGGGNREIDGRSFRIADQAGNITRVEALFFGYYGQTLDDDSLSVKATFGGSTASGTIVTSALDNYVGPPADLGPDSAISWDITALRPPGGAWTWADDFSTLVLYVNPQKTSAADNKYFYLDAIGLRITTDADCEAGASTTLGPVPLRDRFDTTYLTFLSADPEPTSVSGGTIRWDDVGPILPGGSRTVSVTVRTADVAGTLPGDCSTTSAPNTPPPASSICNLVEAGYGTSNVKYLDGRPANDADAKVAVNIAGLAEIRGTVWRDTTAPTGDGWPDNDGEPRLPGVIVSLFACMRVDGVTLEPNSSNKTCANETTGNFWQRMATAVTDASGNYEFIGLAAGTYVVEVGDTDGAPGGANASQFGGAQTAEPNDSQAVSGGNATGTNGVCAGAGGCNNTWGNPAADLDTMNKLGDAGVEETINGVDFGYYLANATIFGKVWEDVDGDAAHPPETGEPPLAGFTVQLWSGGTLTATTTTDAGGSYTFTGLGDGSYEIVVVPARPSGEDWVETCETTGGAGSLDNRIPVTLTAGQLSGSHDFGYTRSGSSDIGDTVYFDFNANGVQDGLEAGIPNVTVRLYEDVDRDGTVDAGVDDQIAADVTDGSGRYLFTGLPAGSYVVEVDTADPAFPGGVTATGDPDVATGRIGGRICLDDDGDLACTGDDGIAGVVVHLYANTNGDDTIDPGEPLVASVVTDVTGGYFLTGLVAGNYLAGVDEATLPNAALVPALQLARTTAAFTNIPLATSSSSYLAAEAGYGQAATFALGNRVWSDADGDNVQDPGETGIAGVRITVTDNGGGASGCAAPGCTVVTDAAGFWIVAGLTNGTYGVDVNPGGTADRLADLRDFRLTSGTEARNVTIAGADRMDADFGYRYSTDGTVLNDRDAGDPTGTIDGRVFVDADGDGAYGRSFAAATTSGSATVTTATAQFTAADVGRRIEGAGIPLGATITAFNSTTSVAISANATATGTSTKTVSAETPRSGTTVNLLDDDGYTVATTATDANGRYYFGSTATCNMTQPTAATGCSGVFVGRYTVESVDALGTRYSVLFLNVASGIAGLDVVYDAAESAPDSRGGVSVDGVHDNLLQDFGYRRFSGSIGDTVYQDANENGTQDLGEPGIGNVTVEIYLCGWTDDGDGLYESGEETGCAATVAATTTAADDPLTAADEGGKYVFTNLATPGPGLFYVVKVVTATLPATSTLVADPDTDGSPCTTLPDPEDPDDEFAPRSVCDDRTLVPTFVAGTNYLGADFGYRIVASGYATVGDRLWVDTNGNGRYDDGEEGIPWISLWFDENGDRDLDWTDANLNGAWDGGEGERWVETDADGYYLFSGLIDGTYSNLRVLNGTADGDPQLERDPDWPPGLPTTPTYEARLTNTGSGDNSVSVIIGGGAVTTLDDGFAGNDPDTCTGCNLSADFGYRYAGANTLEGTICTESGTLNGFCGGTATTYSGVGAGESPLAGVVVSLYLWTDAGTVGQAWNPATGALDGADTFTLLGSTSTNALGDYSFANVPTGKLVIVLSVSETQKLDLTTVDDTPPAGTSTSLEAVSGTATSWQLCDGTTVYEGRTVTVIARQAIEIDGSAQDADFAFDASLGGAIAHDFGDLPDTFVAGTPDTPDYGATLLASDGARHALSAVRLGATVSAEADGRDAPLADLDADDGVTLLSTDWVVGPEGTAVEVSAPAGGWLAGWVDFNGDGDFTDAGEEIVSQAVAAGTCIVPFEVPAGIDGSGLIFFSRFRIYPARPVFVASTGMALDALFQPAAGEVEDYRWNVNVTPAVVSSFTGCDAGGAVALEWRTSSGAASLGFVLRRWDEGRRAFVDAGGRLLPALIGSARGGVYRYLDAAASPVRPQGYELLEIETMGRSTRHGPFVVDAAAPCAAEPPARYTREPAHAATPVAAGPASRKTAAAAADVALAGAGRSVKIATSEEAVHHLRAGDLARALGTTRGAVRQALAENRYSLSVDGRQVAFRVDADGDGIWFFAERQRSQFARENVYRLGPGEAAGLPMKVRDEDASGRRTRERAFPRIVREERDLLPGHAIFTDARRDHWLWDYLVAGEGPKSYTVRADAVAAGAGEAVLTLLFIGATDTEADPDHHALVRVNGTQVGEARWNGLATRQATFTFDAALLVDGENTVEIAAADDTAAPYSLFYLDSFALEYRSRYRATDDRLAFSAAGNRVIRVDGFSTPDVMLFDITHPKRPALVTAAPFADGAGGWGIAIAPRSPEARYVAVTREAAAAPRRLAADRPSRLRNRLNRGRYLVVTTRELLGAARRLAAYRGGAVVDIEDIYDEFNHGVPSPFALRRFLGYAWRRWRVPPRYVVLAGDGTYDYRDNLGAGGNLIPPMMVGTGYGLFPSDTWFADVAGGTAPEMAIGRLPVASAEELGRLVDKIILRESVPDRAWVQRLLALADDADRAGDFPADSDRIAALAPPGARVTRIHLGELPLDDARAALLAGIRAGAGLINYVGHAGFDVLADEGLLRSEDVGLLGNAGRPTVLTAMTCLAGDFSQPGAPGLGELLVLSESGGAAAVWAPTGLSVNELAVRLAEGFYGAGFAAGGAVRVGDAVLAAQREYERARLPGRLLRIYVLLGDPAMRLR